jgi:cardiolipin-specific phospholipase
MKIIMFPFSLFTSSIKISDRIESLRDAESKLLEFAKTRFVPSPSDHHHHSTWSSHHHSFELFDTPIAPPSVVKDKNKNCQVFDDDDDVEHYSLHGVKVVNQQLLASSDDDVSSSSPAPLVLLHGYANGSLYFYRNLHGLSKFFGQIYALDMLGWGLSSRPRFNLHLQHTQQNSNDDAANNNTSSNNDKVKSAEQFFVESLESWRRHHNLPKMTLAGHSMGGYLSVAYAEQYPQHVEKLILLSPVGVPQKVQEEDTQRVSSMPFYIRALIHTVRAMFNRGITPGYFLRSLPHSKSRDMVNGYITNRLPAITCEEEQQYLGEYLYQNSMLPGSGEDCLCEILTAGAFARVPLIDRIPEIKSGGSDENNGEEGLEVHFVYGENDWMDYRGGLDVQRLCHEKMQDRRTTTTTTRSAENNQSPPPKVFVHGVRNAGHLLMLENYQEFNAAMAIAAGREEDLPPGMSRSVEFVCDEVAAAANAEGTTFRSSRKKVVMTEKDAANFFRGGRFNRRESQQQEDDDAVIVEEKKE